jgi:hypothetical protein
LLVLCFPTHRIFSSKSRDGWGAQFHTL